MRHKINQFDQSIILKACKEFDTTELSGAQIAEKYGMSKSNFFYHHGEYKKKSTQQYLKKSVKTWKSQTEKPESEEPKREKTVEEILRGSGKKRTTKTIWPNDILKKQEMTHIRQEGMALKLDDKFKNLSSKNFNVDDFFDFEKMKVK